MKRLIIPLSLLLLAQAVSLQAQINGKRWFAELSAGSGTSGGSFEINRFYDPTFSISADLGYMLTPYIGIVPVSLAYCGFKFDRKNYVDNYWDYKDEYDRRRQEEWWEAHPGYYTDYYYSDISTEIVTDFNALSSLWEASFTPGLVVFTPELAGIRSFVQVGAGIYYARIWIKTVTTREDPYDGYWFRYKNMGLTNLKDRRINFGVLLSSGVEYDFTEKAALTLRLRYNLAFSRKKNEITKIIDLDGLWFFHLTENGLQFNRLLEEKNTRLIEFTGGLKLYF